MKGLKIFQMEHYIISSKFLERTSVLLLSLPAMRIMLSDE
jgi:hypothetical protein